MSRETDRLPAADGFNRKHNREGDILHARYL